MNDNAPRGIYFLAYQASIKQQFQRIQTLWLSGTAILETEQLQSIAEPARLGIHGVLDDLPEPQPMLAAPADGVTVEPVPDTLPKLVGRREVPGPDPIVGRRRVSDEIDGQSADGGSIALHLPGAGPYGYLKLSLPKEPVVTVKGSCFFFVPSIAGIEKLGAE